MKPGASIILMGLRGSGKTTLGPLLAKELGLPFIDLDDQTPRILNRATVADAWNLDGEPAFRQAEVQALAQQLSSGAIVLSLGGGTPTAPGAEQFLRDHSDATGSLVIYLRASAQELRARMQRSGVGGHRPSLTGRNPLDEVYEVLARRDPLYRALAHHTIEVDDAGTEECIRRILQAIG